MEGSHSVSSGPAHQDDSWTCQRCGWVYPNAHPSAKHRRNHKKQCGKIKGFELPSELHKGGSSDEASSGDDSHNKKDNSPPQIEAGIAVPAVEHPNALQSRDLLVTEVNVPDKVESDAPILQSISASLDAKPEVTDHESTRDIINNGTVKTESPAPEPEPNIVSLDGASKTLEEGKVMHTPLVDRIEEPAHILPELYTDEAKEFVKDIKCEDRPTDLTKNLTTVEEHSKPHVPQVDRVEAVVRELPGLDSEANSADKRDAKSEGFSPKNTERIAFLEEPSKTLQDESKLTLTPCVDKVEIAAHKSQGLHSDHGTAKESLLISGLNRQGSSQGDDSWTCRRCGWVYPNPHPSAKHRKKHKKQCGKLKGFELRTEPHNGGSSDDVSSDEDVHAKKEHVSHQSPHSKEQAIETVETESQPPIVVHPAIFVGGITESGSNSLQPKEFSALKVDAPDGELRDTPNVKDISTPDIAPSVVPELPQNVPSLDQQNPLAADNKKDAVVLDQVMKVSCVSDEPDTSLTKESPKHSTMNEEILPNQAIVQEILESSETRLNPSLTESVDTLASEGHGDLGKDTHVEHGSTNKLAEEPAGLSGECAPNLASIPSVSDLKSSDASPPVYFEDKDASILKVDEPSAVVISAMGPRGDGLSNETLDASSGAGLNQSVILKEEIDVSEKPGLSGLDTASSLEALDDPLRKDIGDNSIGGLDVQLEPENSDLSSHTLPPDKVPVENKSLSENLLPLTALSTANVTGLANDADEEARFLSVQTSVNPVQHVPKNELLAQIVGGGNDDTFSSTISKTDETPLMTNMAHPLDNQTTSVGVAEVELPKEVIIPAVATGEAISIQKSLDGFASKNVSSVCEDPSQGATVDTENTNTTSCIATDSGLSDTVKESEVGGISSVKDGEQDKTDALEAMAKPEAKEETPFETRDIGSSDSSYTETYSFTKSESGVSARSELGASSHKLSDSLEIYEDAQDSLETCSVGGSVEENESLDEPRQASGRLQEEPKHLGAASSDERVPGESVVLEQKSTVSNGSRFGEASYEEKAPSLPGTSYEEKAPTLPGTSYEEKTPTLPGTSYGGRNEMEDLKAPSPEAWQEPGPSNVKSEGKKISTSEVTEDSKSGESHTALRSLMAKEGPAKADPIVETSTAAGDLKSSNKKDGSLASANGTKPKSRSFWRQCICCATVH